MTLESSDPVVAQWLCEPLAVDVATSLNRLERSDDVVRVAVMPDVHLAHEVSVGVVMATNRLLYPNAVGGDIGCGMTTLAFDADADLLRDETRAEATLAALYRVVPFNRHSRATRHSALPSFLNERPLSHGGLGSIRRRDGLVQFGTLGRGNHFLEFQHDVENRLWLMVHSGSRALGTAIRDHHVSKAFKACTGLMYLDADSVAGQNYINDASWACEYAQANRRAMLEAVVAFMRSQFSVHVVATTYVDCNHNHLRRESHFGRDLWIHRKGANSAFEGEPGIIPGSMGSCSYHVDGRGHANALRSSSHGAGRRMSRSNARQSISIRDLEREMRGIWFDHRIATQLRDECPRAYKDIRAVMRAQRDLIRINREVWPVLSYKCP